MCDNLLGAKIKALRKSKGLTQSELVGSKVTRNMLSSIENGTANPSLDTLKYIADALSVSVSYLVSEDDDLTFYEKKRRIDKIYRAYQAENFNACVNIINSIERKDDELNYLLAYSYLQIAKQNIAHGSLASATKNLELSAEYSEKTKINTEHIEAQIPMYLAVASNVQSPLLEFDAQKYRNLLVDSVEFELFKYITLDLSYAFETPCYALHIEAKRLIKERNYTEAVKRLLNAAELSKNESYNAFVVFGIYSDLEYCYKQLFDYEKAYTYSTKRMTLLENFKQ